MKFILSKAKLFFPFVLIFIHPACKKTWEPPFIYTANLSLASTPDSVDAGNVYYFPDGMKLQIQLTITSNGSIIKNEPWINRENYHWGDSLKNVKVVGSIVNLSSDTTLNINNYPLILRVYKDSNVLFEESGIEKSYSF